MAYVRMFFSVHFKYHVLVVLVIGNKNMFKLLHSNFSQILSNPFDDIVPRETIKHEKSDKKKKSKSQSKATK